ncbi:DUF4265 domain-containing protein [Arcticibacter tournemirensis]
MLQQDDDFVKVLFRFYSSVLDQWTVEMLWAEIVNEGKGLYQINSIPFYASIASGDIVFAEYDEGEQFLTFREIVQASGNSTVQVVVLNEESESKHLRTRFQELGCESEMFDERYFVLNVPSHLNYRIIKKELEVFRKQEFIDYAEPCLSDNHWCY